MARLAIAVIASALGACSLVIDPDVDSLGAPPRTCTPGDENVCACHGGVQGVQVCNDDHYFNACQCGTAGFGG